MIYVHVIVSHLQKRKNYKIGKRTKEIGVNIRFFVMTIISQDSLAMNLGVTQNTICIILYVPVQAGY